MIISENDFLPAFPYVSLLVPTIAHMTRMSWKIILSMWLFGGNHFRDKKQSFKCFDAVWIIRRAESNYLELNPTRRNNQTERHLHPVFNLTFKYSRFIYSNPGVHFYISSTEQSQISQRW